MQRGAAAATVLTASVIGGVCCTAFALIERRSHAQAWLKMVGGTTVLPDVLRRHMGHGEPHPRHRRTFRLGRPSGLQFTGQADESDAPPESEASSRFLSLLQRP